MRWLHRPWRTALDCSLSYRSYMTWIAASRLPLFLLSSWRSRASTCSLLLTSLMDVDYPHREVLEWRISWPQIQQTCRLTNVKLFIGSIRQHEKISPPEDNFFIDLCEIFFDFATSRLPNKNFSAILLFVIFRRRLTIFLDIFYSVDRCRSVGVEWSSVLICIFFRNVHNQTGVGRLLLCSGWIL